MRQRSVCAGLSGYVRKGGDPIAQIWSGAMMLRHLGEAKAARTVEKAFGEVLARPDVRTPDLGGKASTRHVGDAVAREISAVSGP